MAVPRKRGTPTRSSMNRNNIWVHVSLAVVLVTIAAVIGQIDRWRSALKTPLVQRVSVTNVKSNPIKTKGSNSDPEVLVRFKPGTTLDMIRALAMRNHDQVVDDIESVNGLVAIDDLDDADPQAVANQYAAMSNVSYAEPNTVIQLDDPTAGNTSVDNDSNTYEAGLPNDPQFADQWALHNQGQEGGKERADIDALKAWAKTQGSNNVVVAVLDTGVDYNHVDLRANIWTRPDNVPEYVDDELGSVDDIHGFDVDMDLGDPMDDNGHGTHCAGVIGAEADNGEGIAGINWHVRIMPLKFLGRGGNGTTKAAIEAINYAIDRKKHGVNVRVISASWGSTQRSKALEDVIRAAGDAGILFVAAAGNNGTDNDKRPHYPSNYDLPNVISVAALDRNDQMASFSNYGIKTVHIAAPGKDIVSTWLGDQYRGASGTSMATPHVAGTAALVIAVYPNITVEKLRERLLRSVDKIDSLSGKIASGGRLNAAKAVGN
jgi:subtilisin family serine protease